jgi:transcriptional regulator
MVYLPKAFIEERAEALDALIRENGFATLVTGGAGGIVGSHVPLLWDPGRRLLSGHLARPNPQAAQLVDGAEALAIFHGPHGYVSPRWYGTHPAVPTWNYATVHAYGTVRRVEDEAALSRLVTDLAEFYESGQEAPWRFADVPADFARGLLRGIVGFEIAVTRLEGKFKLSQNRSAADRAGVVAGLRREGDAAARATADLMEQRETER